MTAQDVANTIYRQIGNGPMMMMGAWNHLSGTDDDGRPYLDFRIRGSKRGNHVRITLTPSDLYDVELWKIRGTTIKQVDHVDGIFVGALHSYLEDLTGLRLGI